MENLNFLVILLALFPVANAQGSYFNCPSSVQNYTTNSSFHKNLDSLLGFLKKNASRTGFYSSTVGEGQNQVYGLVQCRGGFPAHECDACATSAASRIVQDCPNKRIAVEWFENCLLRYSTANFFGVVDNSKLALVNINTMQNFLLFKPFLVSLLHNLTVSATTDPSIILYANGSATFTNNVRLYASVECTRDLQLSSCNDCLAGSVTAISQCCSDREGARILSGSCFIRYEIYPFLLDFSNSGFINISCSVESANKAIDSRFQRNLKTLLLSLKTNGTPDAGIRSYGIGDGADRVFSQVLCRGDIDEIMCKNCISDASTQILQRCPKSATGIVWFDYCQLRFSSTNFTGILDTGNKTYKADPTVEDFYSRFLLNLGRLLMNLSNDAVNDKSESMFATGSNPISEVETLYALVQCTRDISSADCRSCLKYASDDISYCCDKKQGASILMGSCRLVYAVTPFFFEKKEQRNIPSTPQLPPNQSSSSTSSQGGTGEKLKRIAILVSTTAGALVLLGFAVFLIRARQRRIEKIRCRREMSLMYIHSLDQHETNHDLPQIGLRTLQSATNHFSEANKLGQGGFGPVYRGMLLNGQEIAVKRLSRSSGQGLREFKNEVKLIANLQHKNLVRLLGCCLEKDEMLLIYEYLPNKSLDAFIYDPQGRARLDWEKRFNIIIGTARGILYLHHDSRLNIIHRDLKAANVLLDEELNPKISDFGMARIFHGNQSEANTKLIVGTYGYMAPEYAMNGLFSTKSDVYSFGVLLLEIISGQLNKAFRLSHLADTLVGYAWRLWSQGEGHEFIDPFLRATGPTSEMLRCIHIGLLCVQEDAENRPTMSSVLLMLCSEYVDLPVPTEPAFSIRGSTQGESKQQSSANVVTNTQIVAR